MSTPCLICSYLFDKKVRNLDPRSDLWTRLDLETLQAERQDKSHWQPTLNDWTAQSFWPFWFTTFKSEFSMTNFTYAAGKRGNSSSSSICARRTLFPPVRPEEDEALSPPYSTQYHYNYYCYTMLQKLSKCEVKVHNTSIYSQLNFAWNQFWQNLNIKIAIFTILETVKLEF